MELRNLLEQANATATRVGESALNVLVVYEDHFSRQWADEWWRRIIQLAGADGVRGQFWSIEALSHRRVFEEAVTAAATAAVMIVSIRANQALPRDFCAWIDAWTPHRLLSDGIMIALISESRKPGAASEFSQGYLRAVAEKIQLEFLLQERTIPQSLQ